MSILSVHGLSKRFGGLHAVSDLTFSVEEGEILAIIGPNGAGKTTTLNLLSGLLGADRGRLCLAGQEVTGLESAQRCRLGLGRAFQVVQPFPEMTVFENVLVGALFGKAGISYKRGAALARQALELCKLIHLKDQPAEQLTLLQEKRLEIARAVATQPKVLLLDEVMAGLRPAEAQEAVGMIKGVRDNGVTVVFIEHVMPVVRQLADKVVVMDHGQKIAEGSYAQVTENAQVIQAYLGDEEAAR